MNANRSLNFRRPAENMIATSIFRLASLYTRHSPIRKGKGFLMELVLGLGIPRYSCWTRSTDGRFFEFNSETRLGHQIFFLGQRECAETRLVNKIVKPGDTAFDIGANIGWYTTLLSRLVGATGSVHAFEPVPSVYASLSRTVEKNRCASNVVLHNKLCGAEVGAGLIYEFPRLHPGLSSSRPLGDAEKIEHRVDMTTIDEMVAAEGIKGIDLIKIDVEGAELEVLKGAHKSLGSGRIGAILIEVNEERAAAFGYRFGDCLDLVAESNNYNIYRVLADNPRLAKVENHADLHNGENLLAVFNSCEKADLIEPLVKA